jgi:hypothetical protein
MDKVKLYSFIFKIDGLTYGGRIPARSWAEAQEKVGQFATVDGELVEEQSPGLCNICRGVISNDLSEAPIVSSDDWDEVFDDA